MLKQTLPDLKDNPRLVGPGVESLSLGLPLLLRGHDPVGSNQVDAKSVPHAIERRRSTISEPPNITKALAGSGMAETSDRSKNAN